MAILRTEFKQAAFRADGPPRTLKERREQRGREEAREEARRLEKQRQDRTIRDWGDLYLSWKHSSQNKQYSNEKSRLERYVYPRLGDLPATQVTKREVQSLVKRLTKTKSKSSNRILSSRTIEDILLSLQKVLKFSGIERPPTRGVTIPKYDNKAQRYFTPEEAQQLLAELRKRSERTHDQAVLALDQGLRAGEVLKLKDFHVDLDAGTIQIVDSKNRARNRTLFLTKRSREVLKKYVPTKKTGAYLFPPKHGGGDHQREIPKSYSETIQDLGWNNGITDRRFRANFHTLRHTYGSWLIQSGQVSLHELQELMGHTSIMTTQRYAHLAPDRQVRSAGVIDSVVRQVPAVESPDDSSGC